MVHLRVQVPFYTPRVGPRDRSQGPQSTSEADNSGGLRVPPPCNIYLRFHLASYAFYRYIVSHRYKERTTHVPSKSPVGQKD